MANFFHILDLIGVALFAISGALVASRRQMDPLGFALMASFTGIGGGTIRDLILDRTVFWIAEPAYLLICLAVAGAVFFSAHLVQQRYLALLWADAVGLAAYGVLGAHLSLAAGTGPLPAIVLGVATATFGGLIRDVIAGETPLVLRQEVYATAAAAAACTYVGAIGAGLGPEWAAACGLAIGFGVRAGGIYRGWSLPRYKPRPGRAQTGQDDNA